MQVNNPFEDIVNRLDRIETQYSRIEKLLAERKQEPPPAQLKRPLTISEAAEIVRMTKGSIYGLVHKRQIPFFKRGKSVLFYYDDLIKWIEVGRRETVSEIEQSARNSRTK